MRIFVHGDTTIEHSWFAPSTRGDSSRAWSSAGGAKFLLDMIGAAVASRHNPPILIANHIQRRTDPKRPSQERKMFQLAEVTRDDQTWGPPKAWRIKQSWPLDAAPSHLRKAVPPSMPTMADDTVICVGNAKDAKKAMEQATKKSATTWRFIFVAESLRPPPFPKGPDRKNSFLITDVAAIRDSQHQVREGNSVEAVITDVMKFVKNNAKSLKWFEHLIIMLRPGAVLYLKRSTDGFPWHASLIYKLQAADYLQEREQGYVFGIKSVLTATLIQKVWVCHAPLQNNILGGIELAVRRCHRLYDLGFPVDNTNGSWGKRVWKQVVGAEKKSHRTKTDGSSWSERLEEYVSLPKTYSLPLNHLRSIFPQDPEGREDLAATSRWSLLDEIVQDGEGSSLGSQSSGHANRQTTMLKLADEIVEKGWKGVQKDSKWPIRVLEVGKLVAVARSDIDSISSVQRLLRAFVDDKARARPMSFGVFGAPGSGKSFGVKQIIENFPDAPDGFKKPVLEFNVAQFTSPADLASALHQVRDVCLLNLIPIAFFDEFDADFGAQRFGWLKHFLMPMQDGKFHDHDGDHNIGRCVFVFAGGINHDFNEFRSRVRDSDFCAAKGPDFLSRLRGHYNVPSLNEDESGVHMLRRAILLHSLTARRRITDSRVRRALLTVGRYRHGARSLEAILEMCSLNRSGMIDASGLPRRDQLDTHVDQEEFFRKFFEKPSETRKSLAR